MIFFTGHKVQYKKPTLPQSNPWESHRHMFQKGKLQDITNSFQSFWGECFSHQNNLLGGTLPNLKKAVGRTAGKMQTSTNLQKPIFWWVLPEVPQPWRHAMFRHRSVWLHGTMLLEQILSGPFWRDFWDYVEDRPPHLGYVLSKGARITRLNLLRGRKRSPWLLSTYKSWDDPPSIKVHSKWHPHKHTQSWKIHAGVLLFDMVS